MGIDELADLVVDGVDIGSTDDEPSKIYPLVADSGNRRVLRDWLVDQESYQVVESDSVLPSSEFDLCVIDHEALSTYRDELVEMKSAAEPVLLPVLLLLPDTRADVIDADGAEIADNVFATTIDEVVSLPIRQTELEWRIQSLLRLKAQSINLQTRNETLRLFQRAIDASGYAIYITDIDGTIKYVNPAFEKITGYSRDEAVGQTPRLIHSGEMPDEYFEEFWAVVRSGEVWESEIVDRRKNGEQYTATQTVAPVRADGEVIAFVAVQSDITERKRREERLKRRTQAIDDAPIGITISDPKQEDNPMIYVNDAFEELTGYSREESTGRNCRFLQGQNTDSERVARIRKAIDEEEPISISLRNYRKDGTEFWNHLEIAPVEDDDGSIINWIGFQQDVTERRQRLRQLGVLDRTLRHNLRNDINVIRGRAETIQDSADGDTAASAAKIVEKSDELIGMAEKEQAITALLRKRTTTSQIDLCPVLEDILLPIQLEYEEASVTVECTGDPTVSVSSKFDTVIEELVRNAIIHNDTPTPEVCVAVTVTGENVRIEVRDNGPTIPEMERKILLGEKPQTPLFHGSGLGLWLVKLVTTRSGGRITFDENDPRGNVVGVELTK